MTPREVIADIRGFVCVYLLVMFNREAAAFKLPQHTWIMAELFYIFIISMPWISMMNTGCIARARITAQAPLLKRF